MIYRDGENRLRWEMGRADVTEHRRDNNRLPIGGLVLETVGKIQDGTMRLDLWNAEVRGTVTTDQGTLQFRTFIAGAKSFDFTPVTARQFRLNILQANEVPTIEEFQLLEAKKP